MVKVASEIAEAKVSPFMNVTGSTGQLLGKRIQLDLYFPPHTKINSPQIRKVNV